MASVMMLMLALAPAAPASNHPKPPQSDGDKVVCRMVTEAGTRIPFRVCRTAAEWENMAKANQDDWTSSRQQRTVGCNQLNC